MEEKKRWANAVITARVPLGTRPDAPREKLVDAAIETFERIEEGSPRWLDGAAVTIRTEIVEGGVPVDAIHFAAKANEAIQSEADRLETRRAAEALLGEGGSGGVESVDLVDLDLQEVAQALGSSPRRLLDVAGEAVDQVGGFRVAGLIIEPAPAAGGGT